jgi:crossover junction endodeoxyribonuclease RusA
VTAQAASPRLSYLKGGDVNRTLVVWVPGHPRPQGSHRHVGNGILVDSSPGLKSWRTLVAWRAWEMAKASGYQAHTGPHAIDLRFVMPAPKRDRGRLARLDASAWHVRRPDLDKLSRAVLDALVEAAVLVDDGLVSELVACKVLSDTVADVEPGVWVTVRALR